MVAPIALYPDALVAQILAASTYPTEVVEADRWVQSQGNAPPEQLAASANEQNWDPSIKALVAFPSVLAQMDRNIRWTTDLGNAYYNQPDDVMSAVQTMRSRAQAAGTLQNTPQQDVSDDGGNIVIAPANPEVVYVPVYNPWGVYGAPIGIYPGYYYGPPAGVYFGAGLGIGFGIGIGIGMWSHWGWGWHNWGFNWRITAGATTLIAAPSTIVASIDPVAHAVSRAAAAPTTMAVDITAVGAPTTVVHNRIVAPRSIVDAAKSWSATEPWWGQLQSWSATAPRRNSASGKSTRPQRGCYRPCPIR